MSRIKKVRWTEKTPGVGRRCVLTGSFFLDFSIFFIKEKDKDTFEEFQR